MSGVDPAGADGPWTDLERPPLRAPALRRALVGPGAWAALEVVARTGSTNADLLARSADAADRTVLVADHQDAGRGRLGRTWTSPPRAGLAVSVLLRPAADPERWSWLPLLTGVAVVDALGGFGVDAGLKWPNDVLVRGPGRAGKVCGVLAEVRGDAVVLGAGLNVAQRAEELPQPAAGPPGSPAALPPTSLALAGARSTDRDTVLRRYLRALRARLDEWSTDPAATAAAYRCACLTLGAPVRAHLPGGDALTGTAEDVDAAGRLVVRGSGGARTSLSAADVVHLRGL